VNQQDKLVVEWHAGPVGHDEGDPLRAVMLDNHARNFELWHEEDKARDPQATDAVIATVKRAIDKINQARNDAMERIDEQVLAGLGDPAADPDVAPTQHSETVGSIVDRLSILSLKVFHMREETEREDAPEEHRRSCLAKLAVLREQRNDLARALNGLIADLQAGLKRFKVYRQMKMYNDPSLNPVLYGKTGE